MGLFNWVDMGFAAAGAAGDQSSAVQEFEKLFAGTMSVTVGDNLSSVILGGQAAHVYGDSFQFTVDWKAMLQSLLGNLGAEGRLGSALLFGAGGYTNMIYGRNTGLVWGENVDVKRAVCATASGRARLWDLLSATDVRGDASGFSASALATSDDPVQAAAQTKFDNVVSLVSGLLSAVMILSSLAMELTVFVCQQMGNPLDKDDDQNEGLSEYQNLFRTLSYTIASRLAGLVVEVELIGQACRDGAKDFKEAFLLSAAPGKWTAYWANKAEDENTLANWLKKRLTLSEQAVAKLKWALKAVAALVVAVLALLAAAAVVIGAIGLNREFKDAHDGTGALQQGWDDLKDKVGG